MNRLGVLPLLGAAWFVLGSCAIQKKPEATPDEVIDLSIKALYSGPEQTGCKAMLDSYCDFLYSPRSSGNIKIRDRDGSLFILQGQTHNDFSQVYYEYSRAKLRNKNFLPRDFLEPLEQRQYFENLKNSLSRKPREHMSTQDRVGSLRADYDLDSAWNSSVEETVLRRMENKFHGFHKIKEDLIPVELLLERRRIRRNLVSEISTSLWRNHKNWKKVESNFEELRQHFISVINQLYIPEPLRASWLERIGSVKLVVPGSFPAISDDECSTTMINAYYYPYLNVITVCAGDFNSEDILETLAHELGHALDLDHSRYLFQRNSPLGKHLAEMRAEVCTPEHFSCNTWKNFKNSFTRELAYLNTYQIELPEFQRCLKKHPSSEPLAQVDIDRLANTVINERVSSLAGSDFFLRITKDTIPLPNGKKQLNPNYLNPCSYYLWTQGEEPLDDEISTLIFFTAEYRCSAGEPTERLKNAIETSKRMSAELEKSVIQMEGEFSPREALEVEGRAASPSERFADVIGSYAVADILRSVPSEWDRRNRFLASSSWQCSKPSLESGFPAESSVQQTYVFDAHTEGSERKKELFTEPVRLALGCKKDFDFKSCELPFKPGPLFPKTELRIPASKRVRKK